MDEPDPREDWTWIDHAREKSTYVIGVLGLFAWFALLYFMFHDVM